jgi:hypothetical protein
MPSRDRTFSLVLGVLILGGVGLLALAAAVTLPGFFASFVPAVGAACLIAGRLGASVDRWLKRELVRDAFQTVFGYILPAELRGELEWVYAQELVCDRFGLRLTLSRTDDPDLLTARFEMSRDFRNVTARTVECQPVVAVDEWFHDGRPSQVLALRATKSGTACGEMEPSPSPSIIVSRQLEKPVSLEPDEHVTVLAEAEETRHLNDAWFLNLIHATANPRVTVDAPDGVAFQVMYGFNRQAGRAAEIGRRTWSLPGTLLPGQVIQVRWWAEARA